jgi:hypothetical protein
MKNGTAFEQTYIVDKAQQLQFSKLLSHKQFPIITLNNSVENGHTTFYNDITIHHIVLSYIMLFWTVMKTVLIVFIRVATVRF